MKNFFSFFVLVLSLFSQNSNAFSSVDSGSGWGMGAGSGASPGEPQWAMTSLSQTSSSADTRAVWADAAGNVYMVGRFVGTVDFWGTTLVATSTTVPSGFIAKVSQNGSPLWVKKLATNNFTELYAVAGLPTGEIYVGGSGSGVFNSDGVSFTIASTNGQNALLLKLDGETGAVTWGGNYGGTGVDYILALAETRNNEIAIGGTFSSSITMQNTTFNSFGSADIFFGRISSAGSFSDLRRFGSKGSEVFGFLDVDGENNAILGMNMVCASGDFFDIGLLIPCAFNSAIVAKFASGVASPLWNRVYSNTTTFRLNKVTVNTGNNSVIVGGYYAGSPNLGGSVNMATPTGVAGFLLMLDKNGEFVWQKQIGDGPIAAGDQVVNIAISRTGYIGLIGNSRSMNAVIDGCVISHPNNNQNPFFAMFDSSGTCLWAKKINGAITGSGYHVTALPNNDFIFGGNTSAADFGFGVIPTGSGNRESFNTLVTGISQSQCAATFTYEDWKQCHFTVDEQGDGTVSGPNGDPDQDSVQNIWEYAFNSSPKNGLQPPQGQFINNNRFVWHYFRNSNATDLVFELQASTDLVNWAPLQNFSLDEYPIDSNTKIVYMTDETPLGSRKFYRWKLQLLPTYAANSNVHKTNWKSVFRGLSIGVQDIFISRAIAATPTQLFPPDFRAQLGKTILKAETGGRIKWVPPAGSKNLFKDSYVVSTKNQTVFLDKSFSHTIEAVADRFYEFAGWEGACSDQNLNVCVVSGNDLTLPLNEIRAKFVLKQATPKVKLRTLRALKNSRFIRLQWNEFMNDAAVIIERKVGKAGLYEEIGSVPARKLQYFDDAEITSKQKYEYRIRFRNLFGESSLSNIVKVSN